MHLPTDGFLSDFGRDLLGVIGFAGVLLTGVGLWLTWIQLRRTASAATAAVEALKESRQRYNRYVVAQASRLLSESKVHTKQLRWSLASARLSDIADLLLQVGSDGSDWSHFAERLQEMERAFDKLEDGKSISPMSGKWNSLLRDLRAKLGERFGPFPLERVEEVE